MAMMSRLTAHDLTRLWQLLHELHALLVPLAATGDGALNERFRHARNRRLRLPVRLTTWIRRRLQPFPDVQPPTLHEPLAVRVAGRRLAIRFVDTPSGHVLHVSDDPRAAPPAPLATWRLTGREAEVLRWLIEGKTNAEIARILATQPRTVDKHCERIYQKLGVENRTAAVRQVLDGTPLGELPPRRTAAKKPAVARRASIG